MDPLRSVLPGRSRARAGQKRGSTARFELRGLSRTHWDLSWTADEPSPTRPKAPSPVFCLRRHVSAVGACRFLYSPPPMDIALVDGAF